MAASNTPPSAIPSKRRFLDRFKLKGDLTVWVIFVALCVISIVEVFSASTHFTSRNGTLFPPILSHILFIFLSFLCTFFVHHIRARFYGSIFVTLYFVSIVMLLWVLFAGVEINGGARWMQIGSVTFQPSELAKITLMAFVAQIVSLTRTVKGVSLRGFLIMSFAAILVVGLIASQNLSTGAMILTVFYITAFMARVQFKYILVSLAIWASLVGLVVGGLLAMPEDPNAEIYSNTIFQRVPTHRNRVASYLQDTPTDPKDFQLTDKNRQEVNAKVAIARSGGWGVLPGNSVQRDYLSQAFSDFIFAIIVEELGLFGCLLTLALYLFLFVRVGRIASQCTSTFDACFALGLGAMLVLQALLNMLVAVGVFPVTGQPLPLISRGGTSTILTGLYFGVILGISHRAQLMKHNRKKKNKNSAARS